MVVPIEAVPPVGQHPAMACAVCTRRRGRRRRRRDSAQLRSSALTPQARIKSIRSAAVVVGLTTSRRSWAASASKTSLAGAVLVAEALPCPAAEMGSHQPQRQQQRQAPATAGALF